MKTFDQEIAELESIGNAADQNGSYQGRTMVNTKIALLRSFEEQIRTIEAIDALTRSEGDIVIILAANEDPRIMKDFHAVEVSGGWTDYKELRFSNHTRLKALHGAVAARIAVEQKIF